MFAVGAGVGVGVGVPDACGVELGVGEAAAAAPLLSDPELGPGPEPGFMSGILPFHPLFAEALVIAGDYFTAIPPAVSMGWLQSRTLDRTPDRMDVSTIDSPYIGRY